MAKPALPFKYKGGITKWNRDVAEAIARSEQWLAELLDLGDPETASRFRAIAGNRLDLGLFHAWAGNGAMARENLHLAATAYLEGVERALPGITSRRITDLTQSARDGAAAAALVGDTALADRLWRYTEQVAAARTTTEDVAPPEDWFASADIDAIYPSARAYGLIRLGRLSGFNALRFVDPPPEVSESEDTWGPNAWGPVEWGPADIDGLLVTAEICYRFGKSWRGYERPSEKGLIPVLQALVASLRSPESAADRATAQAALKKYLGMIRHPSDLRPIYLLVLDLQRAFPHVFIPVAPDPL